MRYCASRYVTRRCRCFSTMFTSDYLERREAEVQLHGFDGGTFDAVLGYMYTGRVEVRSSPRAESYAPCS